MKSISEIANEMYLESQKMFARIKEPHSFSDAQRELLFNGSRLKYEALSMRFIDNTALAFSKDEWHNLGKALHDLLSSKDNAWLKSRNEYRILFQYMACNHIDEGTLIRKGETPDFVLQLGNKQIGIEITELTTSEMKKLDRITNIVHSEGPKSPKLKVFKKEDYDIIPSPTQDVFYCKRHIAEIALEKDVRANIDLIKKKLKHYSVLPGSIDHVVIVCDATRSIHLTASHECEWLFEDLSREQSPVQNVEVVILFDDIKDGRTYSMAWSEYRRKAISL